MVNIVEEIELLKKQSSNSDCFTQLDDSFSQNELNDQEKANATKFLEKLKSDHNENPENIFILNQLWALEAVMGQYEKAAEHIKILINNAPTATLYSTLGEINIRTQNFEAAIEYCKKALELEENRFNSLFLLAYAYKKVNMLDEAIQTYKKALKIKPNSPEIYHNLGNLYNLCKNDPLSAIYCYKKFLKHKTDSIAAKSSLGALYLKAKKYTKGWEYYNYSNLQAMTYCHHSLKDILPLEKFWAGDDIKDKTLFVYFNGGLGDTIMFARFLPLLKTKCKKLLFAPQASLIDLLNDSNLGIDILDKNFEKEELKFDYFLPMMSVAYRLRMNSEKDFAYPQGYLKANPQKIQGYKEKYFHNTKLKVGIKWQGNMRYAHERHFDIEEYYKLLWTENTQFYSLQKGEGIEQLERLKGYDLIDLGSTFDDFTDTAAAIENLDLVISNDTSVAHLAGAMGKECWVLLPFVQEWRWSTDLSYCPWYNSVKLFKQTTPEDWDGVFEDVKRCLNEKLLNLQ